MPRNARKKNTSSFLLALGGGCEVAGAAIGELAAHFAGAPSSSAAAGEEAAQPADEAEEPENASEGVAELCKVVDDAGEVDSSACSTIGFEGSYGMSG